MALYASPTFAVLEWGEESSPRPQKRGVRQGCPLSPYLFAVVMAVLFDAVKAEHAACFGEIAGYSAFSLMGLGVRG